MYSQKSWCDSKYVQDVRNASESARTCIQPCERMRNRKPRVLCACAMETSYPYENIGYNIGYNIDYNDCLYVKTQWYFLRI